MSIQDSNRADKEALSERLSLVPEHSNMAAGNNLTLLSMELLQRNARFDQLRDYLSSTMDRTGGLSITKLGDKYVFQGLPPLFKQPFSWKAEVDFGSNHASDLHGAVQHCRDVWTKNVVNASWRIRDTDEGGSKNYFPLKHGLSLLEMPDELYKSTLAKLAIAGSTLFHFLFYRDRQTNHGMELMGDWLVENSRNSDWVMSVTSNDFFVPWQMLYTHPDPARPLDARGTNFHLDGFWGYRHVIEHNFCDSRFVDAAMIPNGDALLPLVFAFDERLEGLMGRKPISDHRILFKGLGTVACVERSILRHLEDDILDGKFDYRILYFFCHGTGSGSLTATDTDAPCLKLSDDEPITQEVWRTLVARGELMCLPVVFINACQGGQLTTHLYSTLAREMLISGALGVIGPQVEIPIHFAAEYARRFFALLLTRGGTLPNGELARVGPIVRELCRSFLKEYKNPLGLVYSLYRGLDCFVQWPPAATEFSDARVASDSQ